jgi:hypothetical protein
MRGTSLPACYTSRRHPLSHAITPSHVDHAMAGELPTRARPMVRVQHVADQVLRALHETCEGNTEQLSACA